MKRLKPPGLILALVWVVLAQSVAAEWAPSKTELSALPPYCAARFDEKSDAFKRWKVTMGPDFVHIHHYCAGLNFVNRSYSMASTKSRLEILNAAVRNFDYVLTHTQPSFYLRPEALMNRGIALSMMQNQGEAIGSLHKAIEMNPRLPRAYITLADLYDKMKDRSKALETVSEGLRHNPDTRSLQRRYTELGGKLPYPEPTEPMPAVEAEAAKPEEPSTPTPNLVEPVASSNTTPPASVESIAEPPIGSPTNPYCRFCPD